MRLFHHLFIVLLVVAGTWTPSSASSGVATDPSSSSSMTTSKAKEPTSNPKESTTCDCTNATEAITRTKREHWEELVALRWKLEVARRDLEDERSRSIFQLAFQRGGDWLQARSIELQAVYHVVVASLRGEFDSKVRFLISDVEAVPQIVSQKAKVVGTHVSEFLWRSASTLTKAKVSAEKDFVKFLHRSLPVDAVPYIDLIVTFVFVGLPAFVLAVIWHTVTMKLQRCCARLIFRGKAAEDLLRPGEDDADDRRQEVQPRLGRENPQSTNRSNNPMRS